MSKIVCFCRVAAGPRCIVAYDFEARECDELSCTERELLKIIKRVNKDWLFCENASGKAGIVPECLVTEIKQNYDDISDPTYENI